MSVATATPPVRTQDQTKTPRTRRPQVRTFRIVQGNPPFEGRVRISVGAATTLYEFGQVPLDPAFGPGLSFVCRKLFPDGKPAGEGYHLTYRADDPEAPGVDCDCLGHRHYHHCRHADVLAALLKRSAS